MKQYTQYIYKDGEWRAMGSASAGEQSDWDENDNTKESYVKNRTHYKEEISTPVEGTASFSKISTSSAETGEDPGIWGDSWSPDSPIEGENFSLILNGLEINEQWKRVILEIKISEQTSSAECFYIGNLNIFSILMSSLAPESEIITPIVDTGEEYLGMYVSGSQGDTALYVKDNFLANIEVIGNVKNVPITSFNKTFSYHSLQREYLPYEVGNGAEIFNDLENNSATGTYSHAGGRGTIAGHDYQTVIGKYNDNKSDTLFEIGKGDLDNRSNAFEVYLDGRATVGAAPVNNMDVATKQYVDNSIPTVPTKTSELTNDSGFITSDSDEKVKQIVNTSSNSDLKVLFTPNVLNTDYTGQVNKNSNFTYNPSTKAFKTGGTVDGYKLAAASAKGVDTSITATSTSSNLPTSQAVVNLVKGMKGANNGLAELDANGKVPSSQLPSYVDDVLEYTSQSAFPATGETGKIYIAQDTNKTYRWSGTAYTEISASLALGETSSTAYRGDRGKIAYDHSQSTHARTDATATAASTTNGNIKINGTETTVYTHPNSGVSAGTYKSVTVDTNGHVTAGSNPTTLSGYGITDASINNSNRTVTLGNNSIIIPNSTSRLHDGSDSWGGVYQQRASQYTGADALAIGYGTSATGSYTFTSGWNTLASGTGAHAEGQATIAKGTSSHAEGLNTYAGEANSHAEGRPLENLNNAYEIIGTANVTAVEAVASSRLKKYTLDDNSFLKSSIIGKMACLYTSSGSLLSRRIILAYDTTNSTITISCEDSSATAIASITIVDVGGRATGTASHSEGEGTIAAGSYSHSEGYKTWAQDLYSHTEGIGTVARGEAQHVQGKWNTINVNYADIVGNGTAEDARSNAYTLDWNGNARYAGKITVGTGPVNDMDVATKQYVDNAVSSATPTLPNASSTTVGGIKMRLDIDTNTLYITNDGSNA